MNINEIEVNGEKFGIESVNDMYVGRQEPQDEVKPSFWYKPASYIIPYSKYGMERKVGSTNSRGDYTLDTNGQLVETVDTAANAPRTTVMFPLLRNNTYKIVLRTTISATETLYPFAAYFYDNDKNYMSKSEFITVANTAYNLGTTLFEITLPANARYVRLIMPYTFASSSYLYMLYSDVQGQEFTDIVNGVTTNSAAAWYYYDEDAYVLL